MFVFAIGAMVFGGFTAWSLYSVIRDKKPVGFKEYATDVLIGGGALCVMVTAIRACFP